MSSSGLLYRYGSLLKCRFEERSNRFVCKIKRDQNPLEDVYCPNTGSMLNLVPTPAHPSRICWVSTSATSSARKYSKTLELIEDCGAIVGIHSRLANDMVESALHQGLIPELSGFKELQREVAVAAKGPYAKTSDKDSRTDFRLIWKETVPDLAESDDSQDKKDGVFFEKFAYKESGDRNLLKVSTDMLLEVKSVTLAVETDLPFGQRLATFPDSISDRASKHLRCLMDHKQKDPLINRSAVLFLIQRDDCNRFTPCPIDSVYTSLLQQAILVGVEVFVYSVKIEPEDGTVQMLRTGTKISFLQEPPKSLTALFVPKVPSYKRTQQAISDEKHPAKIVRK